MSKIHKLVNAELQEHTLADVVCAIHSFLKDNDVGEREEKDRRHRYTLDEIYSIMQEKNKWFDNWITREQIQKAAMKLAAWGMVLYYHENDELTAIECFANR